MHQKSRLDLRRVTTQQGIRKQQTAQDGTLWCSRLRSGSRRSCLYPSRGGPLWAWLLLGALVVPGAWSFLSEEQEELLVELHNYYRGQVSPSASAMLPLKWDPALKVIAEGYAAKCIWNHNPELEDTGENLYAGTGSLNLAEAMEKWFLEYLDYNFQNNSCDEDKMCGHYTQMVWADTHRVGCAFHLCNTMEGLDWDRVSFLVCNYFPAGNYEGERPYVEGDKCSNCPENLQKCENHLCVADNEEEDDEEDSTVVPPLATSDPSSQPEGEESGSDVESTSAPPAVTATTMSEPIAQDPEDNLGSTTPAATTHPLDFTLQTSTTKDVPLTTEVPLNAEDATWITDKVPWRMADVSPTAEVPTTTEQEEEEEEVEENTEKDGKTESKQGIAQIIFHNKGIKSSGSVFSPSLLLAGLTGVLALRL